MYHMSEKNLRKVYGDEPMSWPTNPAARPNGAAGPLSHGDAEDAEELRALTAADRRQEAEDAAEQGVTVAEWRQFLAEEKIRQEERARDEASGAAAAREAKRRADLRAAVGLPQDVLPDATIGVSNGSIIVYWHEFVIEGRFSIGPDGNPVGPGVRLSPV
jgi:hypothetical protein